jgi:hypothetical protein
MNVRPPHLGPPLDPLHMGFEHKSDLGGRQTPEQRPILPRLNPEPQEALAGVSGAFFPA